MYDMSKVFTLWTEPITGNIILTGNTFMYICGVIELCGLKKIQTYFCTQSETNPVHLSYLKMRFTAKFLCRNNT